MRNVPFAATKEALVEFFAQAGRVVDVVRRTNAEGAWECWLGVARQGHGRWLANEDSMIIPAVLCCA